MSSFTKFYLANRAPAFTPTNFRGTWNDTGGQFTGALEVEKDDGGNISGTSRNETSATNPFDVLLYRGVSGPLEAQTISGTLDVVLGVFQGITSGSICYKLHLYVTVGDSDTVRGTLLSNYAETTSNEWTVDTTFFDGRNLPGRALSSAQTLSSLAVTAGDRLVLEIGYTALNSTTAAKNGAIHFGTKISTDTRIADDLTTGAAGMTTKAGFLTFSNAIAVTTKDRISQFVVEPMGNKDTSATERISQFTPEFMGHQAGNERVSQFVVEQMGHTPGTIRATQFVVEYMFLNPDPEGQQIPLTFVTA